MNTGGQEAMLGEYLHRSLVSCFPPLGAGEIPPGDMGENMGELWQLCGQYWGDRREQIRTHENHGTYVDTIGALYSQH